MRTARGGRGPSRVLGAIAVVGLSWALAGPAQALPPGGAGANTPGTHSRVSPSRIVVRGAVHFTVTGFPAGETLYIKIDDGQGYSDQGTQGSGVVYKQKISKKGSASGSFALPSFVKPGKHWLRFLASQEFTDAKGNVGVKGFTNHSPNFTVVAASGSSGSGGSGSSSKQGSGQSTGTGASAVPSTRVATAKPDPAATVTSSPAAPAASPSGDGVPPTPATTLSGDAGSSGGPPIVGLGALGLAVVVAGGGIWLALRRRPAPGQGRTPST